MNIEGKFVTAEDYALEGKEIVISGNTISYTKRNVYENTYSKVTAPFELKKSSYLPTDAACHNIDVKTDKKPELVYHEEIINGKTVPFISSMIMEYDGRGMIVAFTYVKEEYLPLINEDFESRLYIRCNKSTHSPMMNMGGVAPAMGSMMDFQTMGAGLSMQQPTAGKTAVAPWDCTCGEKGITGKFCPNCGLPCPGLS